MDGLLRINGPYEMTVAEDFSESLYHAVFVSLATIFMVPCKGGR